MPIDYSKYPPDWFTRIRPDILERANNCCENCNVPNYKVILRGFWGGVDCYQDMDGNIFDAATSEGIGSDYVGEVHPTNKLIKIVLTIAHLDHNVTNNEYENLEALCQRCHNRHDNEFRKANRKKNKGIISLFE